MNAMPKAERASYAAALASIDAVLKRDRLPVDQATVDKAVYTSRANWHLWSPNLRPTARTDIEVTLEAEIGHARFDFLRIINKHGAAGMFDVDDRHINPADHYRLPRERLAANALNALRHAAVQLRLVRDTIDRLKGQRDAAYNPDQSAEYRADWAPRYHSTRIELQARIRVRQRSWREFLKQYRAYEGEKS